MATYGHSAKIGLEIHPNLKNIFRYNVFDPTRLTPHKYKFSNNCVLISIIIQLEYIKNGTFLNTTRKKMKNLLQYFITENLDFDNGVTLSQFATIEEDNDLFNKLKKQYPVVLSNFKGLSLNLYTCQHSNKSKAFHLIPIRLGKFFSSSRLNIDLLKDSKDIRPPKKTSRKKNMNNDPTSNKHFKHVLLILNFIRLHQTFRNYAYCSLANLRNTEVCRR